MLGPIAKCKICNHLHDDMVKTKSERFSIVCPKCTVSLIELLDRVMTIAELEVKEFEF